MLRKLAKYLAKEPIMFNTLRRIIEFNFVAIETVIKNELLSDDIQRKILDVPCGTGEFCMLFDASNYVGIDISQKYIDYAVKKYPRTFYCRDALKNGFEDSYFDNVVIIGLFHHLDEKSISGVLKETRRVLKENGKMLLIEDAPITSNWNFIGKFLQRYDVGNSIRPPEVYQQILGRDFIINRYYPIRSGLWDYSVFVLLPK